MSTAMDLQHLASLAQDVHSDRLFFARCYLSICIQVDIKFAFLQFSPTVWFSASVISFNVTEILHLFIYLFIFFVISVSRSLFVARLYRTCASDCFSFHDFRPILLCAHISKTSILFSNCFFVVQVSAPNNSI